jgi:hypothetical protein
MSKKIEDECYLGAGAGCRDFCPINDSVANVCPIDIFPTRHLCHHGFSATYNLKTTFVPPWAKRQMDGQTDGRTDRRMDIRTDGGQTDGGQTDGRTDRQTDEMGAGVRSQLV